MIDDTNPYALLVFAAIAWAAYIRVIIRDRRRDREKRS